MFDSAFDEWHMLVALFEPYGINQTMLLWWLLEMRRMETARVGFMYCRAKQRGIRVMYAGSPLTPYLRGDKKSHTFMHGARNACDGGLYVPDSMLEDFYGRFYEAMRLANVAKVKTGITQVYALVELKRERWRLIIDLDLDVGISGTSLNSTMAAAESTAVHIGEVLGDMYGRDPGIRIKKGTWRVRYNGDQTFSFKGGVHVYTNVIVDRDTAAVVRLFLEQRVEKKPGVNLDLEVSFGATGLRPDGTYKVIKCSCSGTSCSGCHCEGRHFLIRAPPYEADASYEAWRKCLLAPTPDEDETWVFLDNIAVQRISAKDPSWRKRTLRQIEEAVNAADSKRPRSMPEVDSSMANAIRRVMHERSPNIRVGGVFKGDNGMIYAYTNSKDCPFKGSPHASAKLYYLFNPILMTCELRCWHKRKPTDTHSCGRYPTPSKYIRLAKPDYVEIFGREPPLSYYEQQQQIAADMKRLKDEMDEEDRREEEQDPEKYYKI